MASVTAARPSGSPAVAPSAVRLPVVGEAVGVSAAGRLDDLVPVERTVGLYVHVPFCVKRCHYCAFNTAPVEPGGIERYLGALHRELDLLAALPWAGRLRLGTVFFGGGTPSLLEADQLTAVMDRLRARFAIEPGAEITVEGNPESVHRDKLAGYRAAGVNRVSLGVQSLDDAMLPVLGRLHDARGARAAFDAAREAGFTNVSVDLMYGLPGLDVDGWARAVARVLDWGPEHLSAYGLSLDPGSRWGADGAPALPPESVVVDQYWALARLGAERGFEHYEISNYARPGFRSEHNQVYWRRQEYLAAGPGACGFAGDVRWSNVKPTARYCALLENDRLPVGAGERLTAEQALGERLILGLRLADGVPAAWLGERLDREPRLAGVVAAWEDGALLVREGERVRLTEAGFLLSDALFTDLL
jgi:oxygen-independent coproporphyrinogen-3 oxidase